MPFLFVSLNCHPSYSEECLWMMFLFVYLQVTNYKAQWRDVHQMLHTLGDYTHFVDLAGSTKARKCFQDYILQRKHEYTQYRMETYLNQLRCVLPKVLPNLDIIADR